MAALSSIYGKYDCANASTHTYNEKGERIFVGENGIIRRWIDGSNIKLWIDESTFRNQMEANQAYDATDQGAARWTRIGSQVDAPVHFWMVSPPEKAKVVVRFSPNPEKPTWIASTLLPREGEIPLWIYPRFFTYGAAAQAGILAHEMGHIMGLRHEFLEPGLSPKFQVGPINPTSVMSDTLPYTIQESDRALLRVFYDMHSSPSDDFKFEVIPTDV